MREAPRGARLVGFCLSALAALASGTAPKHQAEARKGLGTFRNTYYDFPYEREFASGPPHKRLFDRKCRPIATVPKAFHDAVCMQGSGRLASGTTISFARRDCSCAARCPRSGQHICFDALSAKRFPWGRGATGAAIQPMVSVAVDSAIIALNTPIYIPAYVGIELPDGREHDGCFLAQDRGSGVRGRHVDVFAGTPAMTRRYNRMVPSNRGVRVFTGVARCEALRPPPRARTRHAR